MTNTQEKLLPCPLKNHPLVKAFDEVQGIWFGGWAGTTEDILKAMDKIWDSRPHPQVDNKELIKKAYYEGFADCDARPLTTLKDNWDKSKSKQALTRQKSSQNEVCSTPPHPEAKELVERINKEIKAWEVAAKKSSRKTADGMKDYELLKDCQSFIEKVGGGNGWMPIETAPKDKKLWLIVESFSGSQEYQCGWWDEERQEFTWIGKSSHWKAVLYQLPQPPVTTNKESV